MLAISTALLIARARTSNRTLTDLTAIVSSSAVASCTPPAVMVSDKRGAWDKDLNAGAGGKYVYLCAIYGAGTPSPSSIVALQAAGQTSKYQPNCATGLAPLGGASAVDLNDGSKNPSCGAAVGSSLYLCVQHGGPAVK